MSTTHIATITSPPQTVRYAPHAARQHANPDLMRS